MNETCEVVRDLMPLVLDEAASDGSQHMVQAHVRTCAECAAYMAQLKAGLPAGNAGEQEECAAFDAAAHSLRKKKRWRTIRNILLGALIVCVLGLAWLFTYDWLMNETRQIPTSDYGVSLSLLNDGSLVVSFEYRESMEYLGTTQQTVASADGNILYIGVEKYIMERPTSLPMQNGSGMKLAPGWETANVEIRQGTPADYRVLWRQGDGNAAIPAASPEMEEYYAWKTVVRRLDAHGTGTADGKALFEAADRERYSLALRQEDALAACVPEWQPRVEKQYLPLDEETIQWILAGVAE